MIRGTTPTLEFTLPFDCSLLTEMYITFAQYGTTVLEKSMADCTCSGTLVTLSLSQEDTLKMKQDMVMLMQLRNHSGVVRLQLFTLLMEQTIINQHITDHQLQQTSHLVFLEES